MPSPCLTRERIEQHDAHHQGGAADHRDADRCRGRRGRSRGLVEELLDVEALAGFEVMAAVLAERLPLRDEGLAARARLGPAAGLGVGRGTLRGRPLVSKERGGGSPGRRSLSLIVHQQRDVKRLAKVARGERDGLLPVTGLRLRFRARAASRTPDRPSRHPASKRAAGRAAHGTSPRTSDISVGEDPPPAGYSEPPGSGDNGWSRTWSDGPGPVAHRSGPGNDGPAELPGLSATRLACLIVSLPDRAPTADFPSRKSPWRLPGLRLDCVHALYRVAGDGSSRKTPEMTVS